MERAHGLGPELKGGACHPHTQPLPAPLLSLLLQRAWAASMRPHEAVAHEAVVVPQEHYNWALCQALVQAGCASGHPELQPGSSTLGWWGSPAPHWQPDQQAMADGPGAELGRQWGEGRGRVGRRGRGRSGREGEGQGALRGWAGGQGQGQGRGPVHSPSAKWGR